MPSLTDRHKAGANQPKESHEVVHPAIEEREQYQPKANQRGFGISGSVGIKYGVMVVHGCIIPDFQENIDCR